MTSGRNAESPLLRYRAFGCHWTSEIPLLSFQSCAVDTAPDTNQPVTVSLETRALQPRDVIVAGRHLSRCTDGFRYSTNDGFTLDTFGPDRVVIHDSSASSGLLPSAFYGTITAIILASRGGLPIHGSAVELNGQAVLLCGTSGAGKSTLAASLLARGARLISDDLSVIYSQLPGNAPLLYAGRTNIRLFPEVADMLGAIVPFSEPPFFADKKLAVTPPRVDAHVPVPLSAIFLLDHETPAPGEVAKSLIQQMYRPRWMARVPGKHLRLANLTLTAREVPFYGIPGIDVRNKLSFEKAAEVVLQRIS